jgi:hypothetical protein
METGWVGLHLDRISVLNKKSGLQVTTVSSAPSQPDSPRFVLGLLCTITLGGYKSTWDCRPSIITSDHVA